MRFTRFEHSSFVLTEGSDRLVVDPGTFTQPLRGLAMVTSLFVSHAHPDHMDRKKINDLKTKNPRMVVFGTPEVADALSPLPVSIARDKDVGDVGPFHMEFVGSTHAEILPSLPAVQNIGVIVNDALFYPGDALNVPARRVSVLAAPVAGAWLRIADVQDYVTAVQPDRYIPLHGGVLSEDGADLIDGLLRHISQSTRVQVIQLLPGESINI